LPVRRADLGKWLFQPAVFASLLVPAAAGTAIGWRAGRWVGAAVGAGAGVLVALLLLVAVDRLTSVLVSPSGRTDRGRTERTETDHGRTGRSQVDQSRVDRSRADGRRRA
jgi:hypothetical protein